jgi:tetratricopeptide (TPR) repeat protein
MEHGRVGVNPFQYTGDTIVRSDIVLATHTSEGQRLSKNQIQGVATHELGHAIGIQGHSPYPEDLMYWAVNDAQTGSLTTRDKNTIRLLYKIDADIQNHAGVSTAETRNVYDGLGKAQALMSQGRPAEAVPLLQQAIAHNGRDARLHAALGLALQQSGNATGAMQSYRQALNLDDTLWQPKYNLAGLLHNEGVRLAQSGHVSQARTYFQQTVSLYEQVQRSGEAPAEIGNALSVARKNLSLTNP